MIVRYTAAALAEYQAAANWYDDTNLGSGADFVAAIAQAESKITALPHTWPEWPAARPGTRCYRMPGWPYSVAYRIDEPEIVIIAVVHQRRRPGYWFKRPDR